MPEMQAYAEDEVGQRKDCVGLPVVQLRGSWKMRNNNRKSRKRSSLHRFYLISPKANADTSALVERLISLKPVQEVFLTDGDFGYLVKARVCAQGKPADVLDYMAKRIDRKYGKVVSYYQYRK